MNLAASPSCPLCCGKTHRALEEIQVRELERLYKNLMGFSVISAFHDVHTLRFLECTDCELRFFDPLITGSGEFYGKLNSKPWYYFDDKYEYRFVASLIQPGESVLDVGSGKGAFAAHLPPRTSYLGLDFNEEAVEWARKQGRTVLREDVETHVDSYAQSYDWVVSFQSLEHVSDVRGLLNSMARCVKLGGALVIVVPSEDSFVGRASDAPLNMPPHHVTRWSDATLRRVALVIGFPLELLHHEPLQQEHKAWAGAVMARAFLGLSCNLVDAARHSFARKIRDNAVRVLARFILHRLPQAMMPHGHSVVCVYRRRSA